MPGQHGSGNNGGGCCNCMGEEELTTPGSQCLLPYIDTRGVTALNEAVHHSAAGLLKPFHERLDESHMCCSAEGDHELMIHIPFITPCKITGIYVIGGDNGTSPKHMKLFINKPDLDFLNITDAIPIQEIDMVPDFCGTLEYPLKVAKFSNVSHLTLYFTETHGAEMTELFYIGLRGQGSGYKRSAVVTVYESRPNLKDHSVKSLSPMGLTESTSEDALNGQLASTRILFHLSGFRVCSITKGSQAHLAGLELFFDFIIEADGVCYAVNDQPQTALEQFVTQIRSSTNCTIKLVVYNSRTRAFRDIWVTPQPSTETTGPLGISLSHSQRIMEPSTGLKVLKVFPNSPASAAGLMEEHDYLIGTPESIFKSADDLSYFLRWSSAREFCPLSLIVYNSKLEASRVVHLQPQANWGGEGCCGLSLGSGLLHYPPPPRHIHKASYVYYTYCGASGTTGGEGYKEAIVVKAPGCSRIHQSECPPLPHIQSSCFSDTQMLTEKIMTSETGHLDHGNSIGIGDVHMFSSTKRDASPPLETSSMFRVGGVAPRYIEDQQQNLLPLKEDEPPGATSSLVVTPITTTVSPRSMTTFAAGVSTMTPSSVTAITPPSSQQQQHKEPSSQQQQHKEPSPQSTVPPPRPAISTKDGNPSTRFIVNEQGLRICLYKWALPANSNSTPRAAVLLIHGVTSHARFEYLYHPQCAAAEELWRQKKALLPNFVIPAAVAGSQLDPQAANSESNQTTEPSSPLPSHLEETPSPSCNTIKDLFFTPTGGSSLVTLSAALTKSSDGNTAAPLLSSSDATTKVEGVTEPPSVVLGRRDVPELQASDYQIVYENSWVERFGKAGFIVFAIDLQSHGLSDGWNSEDCHVQDFNFFANDVVASITEIRRELAHSNLGDLSLFAVGISMGGLVLARTLELGSQSGQLSRDVLRGAVLLAPALSLGKLKGNKGNAVLFPLMKFCSSAFPSAKVAQKERNMKYYHIEQLCSLDPLVYKEKIHARLASEMLGAIDVAHKDAVEIRKDLSLLLCHSIYDTMCDPEGSHQFLEELPVADKELWRIHDMWHFLTKEPGTHQLLGHVLEWMNERLAMDAKHKTNE